MKSQFFSPKILCRLSLFHKASISFQPQYIGPKRFSNTMSEAKEFPPQKVKEVVIEVAKLLKERGETVSVAETVCFICFLVVAV